MVMIFSSKQDKRRFREAEIRHFNRERNADGHLKHIYCDSARFHVLSWSSRGMHCSEPECEINFRQTAGK